MSFSQELKNIYLKDYKAPDFSVESVHLSFHLKGIATEVTSKMKLSKSSSVKDLFLNGESIVFLDAHLDGKLLTSSDLEVTDFGLTIKNVPESFELTIRNTLDPIKNKSLNGLYKSGNIFCTQNEPEGFRRITYYLDRPDVMAQFTTKIIAPKKEYPILLSNGNLVSQGDLEGGLHWVEWSDPFPKPCYLYALVAGDLVLVKDVFVTKSGRKIDLKIYVDKGNEDKCDHAMISLKKSMKWDEDRFGLEYDLDIYMIVAVDSFNMGAMENKGLNIFNSSCVLARPETATDSDFTSIEAIVGHEYFHNWTGNRVTCRDWFQLTLKEGLTVFRDQEFSSDLNSRAVERIQNVKTLKESQFIEDAGPTSHPIKPTEYIEINNFYTSTVYEKGAEVIRMIDIMLSEEGFRKGMDRYFELFDGKAVTTEDFLFAMSDANDSFDFSKFLSWYEQSGTPHIKVSHHYDKTKQEFHLEVEQKLLDKNQKKSYQFPFGFALLDQEGREAQLSLKNSTTSQPFLDRGYLNIEKKKESFVFKDIEKDVIPSLNRDFSAPITLEHDLKEEDLYFLMKKDSDNLNRYEIAQYLATKEIKKYSLEISPNYLNAYEELLKNENLDCSIKSILLTLPAERTLYGNSGMIDVEKTFHFKENLKKVLAQKFEKDWMKIYEENSHQKDYQIDPTSIGQRSLKNLSLNFLSSLYLEKEDIVDLIYKQFLEATNMTDQLSALGTLVSMNHKKSKEAVERFYEQWNENTLVMQKWIAIQASSSLESTYEVVKELERNKVYDSSVPNLFAALYYSFGRNHIHFHHKTGRGYQLIGSKILEIDKINPQSASSLAKAFRDYKRVSNTQKELMKNSLDKIISHKNLSKNTFEIVDKIMSFNQN